MNQAIKDYIKTCPIAPHLTVANLLRAGYHSYPQKWKSEDEQTKTILDTVWKDGLYVLPDYFSAEQCVAMRSEIDFVIENNKQHVSFDDLIGDARLFGAEKVSAMIMGFNQDPYLMKLANLYNGDTTYNPFTLAARLNPNEINKDKDHGWHRDSLRRQFKTIIYLDDTTEANGPYQYIKGSNHLNKILVDGIRGKIPYMSIAVSPQSANKIIEKDPARLATVTGKAGTIIITDTSGIHRGSTIKAGHRYALTNYYMYADQIGPHLKNFGSLAYTE